LQWYELVPVFSYLFLRGKCSVCQSRISWQYPLVEFLTGITFLGIFFHYQSSIENLGWIGMISLIFSYIIASIFIVIIVYDQPFCWS
jgi:prepilin signal peptidase PulO-like enzyme (type II secretory pathway)